MIQLKITEHAHKQFCQRVEHIAYEQLLTTCNKQLLARGKPRRKECFLQLGEVWWVYDFTDEVVTFITCYGRSIIDLPLALSWAERNKDRINLKALI
jgi:hypothetical protein